jgi:hypothetical protein
LSHVLNDHDTFFHSDLLLAITFLAVEERKQLVELVRPRLE